MKPRKAITQAIYNAVANLEEPFDRQDVWDAIAPESKPYTISHISSMLYTLAAQGQLNCVVRGSPGPHGHSAKFSRTEKFSTIVERHWRAMQKSKPAPAPAAELPPLERRWRELRETMNIEVPEIAINFNSRE